MLRQRRIAFLTLAILVLTTWEVSAQYYDLHWYIGNGGILDFTGGGNPTVTFPGGYTFGESSSAVTDNQGTVLFFTDGLTVYSGNGIAMPNGSGLMGGTSSTDGTLILRRPGTCQQYYLFTLEDHLTAPIDFRYSIVDMALNGGLGDVVAGQKNVLRGTDESEQLEAVPHTNGIDWWVITHPIGGNTFQAWLVTGAGVASVPVTSNCGPIYTLYNYIGELSANHAGTKLAGSLTFNSTSVYVYDFNATTGIVSNPVPAAAIVNSGPYGLQFSPNDQILYVSDLWVNNQLVQVDVANPALTNVLITLTGSNYLFGKIVEAPDGRIVVTRPGLSVLGTIDNPNVWGAGANYNPTSIAMPTGYTGSFALPHYPPSLQTSHNLPGQDSAWFVQDPCNSDSVTFDFSAYFAHDSITWNFGDPASGTANTSTTSPVIHQFSGPGIYHVQLYIHGCYPDTLSLSVTVTPFLAVNLGNDTTLCDRASLTLTALPAIGTYAWSDGSNDNTLEVTLSGTYWVQVTDANGCMARDTITIIKSPKPTVEITGSPHICPGDSTQLDAGNPGNTYLWSNGQSTQQIWVSQPGTYAVTVTNSAGCRESDGILIQELVDFAYSLGSDTTLCAESHLTLGMQIPFSQSLWNTGQRSELIRVNESGTYSVTVSTACFTHSDTVEVTFLNDPGPYAPNAFTPNDDGINDHFGFVTGPNIEDFDLAIFDRWGKMIWQTRDPNLEWDGTYGGMDAPEGVYAYRVQYRNCFGYLTNKGGSITLIR